MKRHISLIVLLFAAVFLFTGCVRIRSTLTVKSDGKIDISIIYAFSESMSSLSGENGTFDTEAAESQGFRYATYSEDGYDGYVFTKNDVTDLSDGILNNSVSFTKDGSDYVLDIPWDPDEEESDASSLASAGAMVSAQNGFAEFVVVLPVRPTSHNATGVSEDGRTLTWNLLTMGSRRSIHVEYTLVSPVLLWIMRIGIAFAVIAFCVILFFVVRGLAIKIRTKKKAAENPVMNELKKYKEMLDEGLITREEYDAKKTEILNLPSKEGRVNGDTGYSIEER